MSYQDVSPPMNAKELADAEAGWRTWCRRRSALYFVLALVALAVVIYGGIHVDRGPVGLFQDKTVMRVWSIESPTWFLWLWLASILGIGAFGFQGMAHLVKSDDAGDLRGEKRELDAEGTEKLYALIAEVPEVHDIVAGWYADGRQINARALRELLYEKSKADAAAEALKLRTDLAQRFSKPSTETHA